MHGTVRSITINTVAVMHMIKITGIINDMTTIIQNIKDTGTIKESITGIHLPGRITKGVYSTVLILAPKDIPTDTIKAIIMIIHFQRAGN